MRHLYTVSLFLLTILVTSCSTVAPPAATPVKKTTWEERQAKISQFQTWHLNGKIAVQTAQQSGSATIDWIQHDNRYNVALYGPLGTNSLKLYGQPGKVSMETSDGKKMTADSAETLLAKGWGFHLPVSYLRYWVRGLPVPGMAANPKLDNYQRITSLNQGGWYVQYQSYTTVGNLDLPSRITITSPSLRTKMVIYKWGV